MTEANGQPGTEASPARKSCLKSALIGCSVVAVLGALFVAGVLLAVRWYGIVHTLLGLLGLGVVLAIMAAWFREYWLDLLLFFDDQGSVGSASQRRRRWRQGASGGKSGPPTSKPAPEDDPSPPL